MPRAAIEKKIQKQILPVCPGFLYRKSQEVGDDLSVCVMNLLTEVSILSSFLVESVGKVEINFSHCHMTSCWSRDKWI